MEHCNNVSIFKSLAALEILSQTEQKLLVNTYQQLRDYGHKATLQNEALLIDKSLLINQKDVTQLWTKFL